MKKTFPLFLFGLLFSMVIFAQRPTIYIAPFAYEGKDVRGLLPSFRAAVLDGINRSMRVKILDGQADTLKTNLMGTAAFLKADYLFKCEMLNHNVTDVLNLIKTVQNAVDKKSSSITDQISYRVELIRVSDGTSVSIHKFDRTGYDYDYYKNGQALAGATNDALVRVRAQMFAYMESLFPLKGDIVEVAEEKNGKLKKVYINLGNNAFVHRETFFNVYVERTVANEIVRDFVGIVRLDEIKGDNISLCSVRKGDKAIKAALDKGVKLKIVSTVR